MDVPKIAENGGDSEEVTRRPAHRKLKARSDEVETGGRR